jgi:hypothetical protein
MSPAIETTRLIQANETLPCEYCGQIGGEPREWVDEDPTVGYRAKGHGCSLCTPAARPVTIPDVRKGDLIYMPQKGLITVGLVLYVYDGGCHYCSVELDNSGQFYSCHSNTALPWSFLRDAGAMFLRVAKPAIVTDDGQDVEF